MSAILNGRRRHNRQASAPPGQVRVAIYTRKSVLQGLDQEFNSIDAQRHAVESYVESQRGAGWIALAERYDDGGFSGGDMDRPALRRLVADIESGKIDCIAVYRIDRLSRSFADYVAILKLLEQHGVTFVSVTEQFNTTTPTGRLVLNQLILFSQFEREVIAERIRDKVRATRRRGMWTGGRPVLGYDVVDRKLVVNPAEAEQVRDMFELYLERGSLRATVDELSRRGWCNKSFTSKGGRHNAGRPFTKATLHALLSNVLYRGRVRCHDEIVDGVHEPIVGESLWGAVQQRLRSNSSQGGAQERNKTGAVLRGLVHCGRCGSAMLHTFTTKGTRRYRYYACSRYHNQGAASCPEARVPAGRFERFVADQVQLIGQDEELLAKTAKAVADAIAHRREQLTAERRRLEREHRRIVDDRGGGRPACSEERDSDDQFQRLEHRLGEVHGQLDALGNRIVDEDDLRDALAGFTPIWDQLFPRERERILRLLIERVTYHPDGRDVDIELRACGIESLAQEARQES